jgi:hypothetical protein
VVRSCAGARQDDARLQPACSVPDLRIRRRRSLRGAHTWDAGRRSLAGQLNDLGRPPGPSDRAYHWPTVANRALASILRSLFPTAVAESAAAIDELARRFASSAQAALPLGIYRRSEARGADVAAHVFDWSTTTEATKRS